MARWRERSAIVRSFRRSFLPLCFCFVFSMLWPDENRKQVAHFFFQFSCPGGFFVFQCKPEKISERDIQLLSEFLQKRQAWLSVVVFNQREIIGGDAKILG